MRNPGLVLLAAGGSSRMGQPKQLLPCGGTTLLRRACETAVATPYRPIVVVLGRDAPACIAACEGLPVNFVTNADWERGMASSIAAGVDELERLSPDIAGALFFLVDQPDLTTSWLETLVARWHPSVWPIVATAYGADRGVPAVFDRQFFPSLKALPANEGARSLLREETRRTFSANPFHPLRDIDTPADYRDFVEEIEHTAKSAADALASRTAHEEAKSRYAHVGFSPGRTAPA